jgi:hypothetical protein
MKLPKGHTATADVTYGEGGWRCEWYADDGKGDGYGDHALVQYWYGSREDCEERAAGAAPQDGWYRPVYQDGPDRTDPGYRLDNF